ncbi:MAG: hypothetical protein FWD63_02145 [Propionibacteriaceae bacterium]|nr:hypothetical protein [Propionibacteriaceae bacterium]
MNTKKKRMFGAGAAVAVSAAIFGCVATPAMADGDWYGSWSCPASTVVIASGVSDGSGQMLEYAASHSSGQGAYAKGTTVVWKGNFYGGGSWEVVGDGAASGTGYCGV